MPTIQQDDAFVTQLIAEFADFAAGEGDARLGPRALLLLELANQQMMAALLRREAHNRLLLVRNAFSLDALVAACAPYRRYDGRRGQVERYTLHQLCWALLLQYLCGYSLLEMEQALASDMLLRWCCGFALYERTPDHSTLSRFALWCSHHLPDKPFITLLQQIDAAFPHDPAQPQIGDTFAMRSRTADSNRTQMLRDGCRRLLACLEQCHAQAHAAVLQQLNQTLLFGAEGEMREEQLPPDQRQRRECDTARGAAHCLRLVRHQIVLHGLPPSAFATPWARRAAAQAGTPDGAAPVTAAANQPPHDAEQTQRHQLGSWLGVLDKILADEFVLSDWEDDPGVEGEDTAGAAADEAAQLLPRHEPATATATAAQPDELATETLYIASNAAETIYIAPTASAVAASAQPAAQTEPPLRPPARAAQRRGSKGSKSAPGAYRVGSTQDVHATYRVHGESIVLGYNVALLTCGDFVRYLQVYTGARPDGDTPALLLAGQAQTLGIHPHKLIFDRAAGAPKRFADVAKVSGGRTQLVAPLLRAGQRGPLFGPDDFLLQEHAGLLQLLCPAGLRTNRAYRSPTGDGWDYRFLASECNHVPAATQTSEQTDEQSGGQTDRQTDRRRNKADQPACRCPLWDKCRGAASRPTRHRMVFVSDYTRQQHAALAYTRTAAYRSDMRKRAAVERVIAALTRYNGLRRARSTGIVAATFQALMGATAYNLKRWCVLTRQQQRQPSHEPPDAPD